MLRGSRPGERRGGRKRGTPHRRTILRDRILAIGLDHPAASRRAFALEALFGVVQDATANPKARSKAALKIAEFLLPKAAKKAKVIPDEYGFLISSNLASAYRDLKLELWALQPTRRIPAGHLRTWRGQIAMPALAESGHST